jgi:hypothetical protein
MAEPPLPPRSTRHLRVNIDARLVERLRRDAEAAGWPTARELEYKLERMIHIEDLESKARMELDRRERDEETAPVSFHRYSKYRRND